MIAYFPKASAYLSNVNLNSADPLDKKAKQLLEDETAYERASQALRRRFSRGAMEVEGIDRGSRLTKVKRDGRGGKFDYLVQGADGAWVKPEERVWIVAMYALWQDSK